MSWAQLAQQFVACLHFVHRRHDLEVLGPNDKVRDVKQEPIQKEGEVAENQKTSLIVLVLTLVVACS